jgi:hypothetical protein
MDVGEVMQLSLESLILLARSGDTQAAVAMDQYESYSPTTPVEIYYLGVEDIFLLHTPTTAVQDHLVAGQHLAKRSHTLMGMPAPSKRVL